MEIEHRPVLHGVGWPGDVKKIALKIDKIMKIYFRPSLSSRKAVEETVKSLSQGINL